MSHKFKLPIGDWSNDGHGRCDYYFVESNVSAEDLVPIYIAMDEAYNISSQVNEYSESKLDDDYIQFMVKLGLEPKDYITDFLDPYINSRELAQLILDLLMRFDQGLSLRFSEDIPEFNNWLGHKVTGKKGSVLSLPGYGLFE